MKFWNVGAASMAAIIMLAAACLSGSNTNTPLNVEKAKIVVDAFPAIDSAGLYVAQMDGRPRSTASPIRFIGAASITTPGTPSSLGATRSVRYA